MNNQVISRQAYIGDSLVTEPTLGKQEGCEMGRFLVQGVVAVNNIQLGKDLGFCGNGLEDGLHLGEWM